MIDNPGAVAGIKQILSMFPNQDVIALCATVTQGLLKNKIQTREAAIDAILKYSPDPTSILKRKALTRNHLFEYLDSAGIEVQLPITKDELIDRIVQAWDPKRARLDTKPTDTDAVSQESNIEAQDTAEFEMACIQQSEITSSAMSQHPSSSTVSTSISSSDISVSEVDEMALQFCTWFYSLMNKDEVMSHDHFYRNSSIEIHLYSDEHEEVLDCFHDGENVAKLLFDVKSKHKLYFNANVNKDGTRLKMDPHGIAMIICCGTLHINDVVSGVFEQMFALARDPTSENNWKIRTSTLILRSKSNVTGMPKLGDEIRLLRKELL